jgi:hypothetical protein
MRKQRNKTARLVNLAHHPNLHIHITKKNKGAQIRGYEDVTKKKMEWWIG